MMRLLRLLEFALGRPTLVARRYYDSREAGLLGLEYKKVPIVGHDCSPSAEQALHCIKCGDVFSASHALFGVKVPRPVD